jgi:hypothetical protein
MRDAMTLREIRGACSVLKVKLNKVMSTIEQLRGREPEVSDTDRADSFDNAYDTAEHIAMKALVLLDQLLTREDRP